MYLYLAVPVSISNVFSRENLCKLQQTEVRGQRGSQQLNLDSNRFVSMSYIQGCFPWDAQRKDDDKSNLRLT